MKWFLFQWAVILFAILIGLASGWIVMEAITTIASPFHWLMLTSILSVVLITPLANGATIATTIASYYDRLVRWAWSRWGY